MNLLLLHWIYLYSWLNPNDKVDEITGLISLKSTVVDLIFLIVLNIEQLHVIIFWVRWLCKTYSFSVVNAWSELGKGQTVHLYRRSVKSYIIHTRLSQCIQLPLYSFIFDKFNVNVYIYNYDEKAPSTCAYKVLFPKASHD